MSLLWTILIGFVAGALAKFLMPGKDPGGMIITILLGVAGSFVGRYVGDMVGISGKGTLGEVLVATGGAIILLLLYRVIKK